LKLALWVQRGLAFLLQALVGIPFRFLARLVSRIGAPVYHRWLTLSARTRRGEQSRLRSTGAPAWGLPLAATIIVVFAGAPSVFAHESSQTTGSRSLLARITHADDSAEIVETVAVRPRTPTRVAAVGSGGIGGSDGETDTSVGDFVFSTALSADAGPLGGGTSDTLPTRTDPVDYTVEGGDTVSLIAAKFGLGYKSILWSNGITESSLIKPGDVLHIPPTDGLLHTVAKGENLNTLVTKYRADLNGTLDVNRLPDPSAVTVGQIVTLVGGQPPEPPPSTLTRRTAFFDVASEPASSGSGPVGKRVAGSGFLWPTPMRKINQYFKGYRHAGVDIEGTYSSPIFAAADGTVEAVSFQRYGYGYHVIIRHSGGRETLYGHASKIFVRVGQHVDRGQTIAMVGSTGRSTGTHLHFEIILNGVKVNPLPYI
jgi:murein DD-endopeptidase MepM/ murein hydrolase activator NlpD